MPMPEAQSVQNVEITNEMVAMVGAPEA